jgi:gliding motility-associated protein GldC
MKKSDINFKIELDEQNVPESILWDATDKPGDADHTKAISVAVWDDIEKNTMRLDLWTKDMPVLEMKKFYVDALGGMSQSLLSATGDEGMASQISTLCDVLSKTLEEELKNAQ